MKSPLGGLHLPLPDANLGGCFGSKKEAFMQSAYPLSRCPACKKAFRMEITYLMAPAPVLGQLICPHCGLKFQRFDPQYLKGTIARAAAQ